jgi:hypothetical protein
VGQFTEPAAAVWSPGAAVKREQHRAAGEKFRECVPIPLLSRQFERGRGDERRRVAHQNNFTSTTSPASTMSVCAGISKYPSASDMLVMSPEALNAGTAMPSVIFTV